ncbi:MAG: fluoride efflux transporter CrcB [Bdellovibrionaceae bacterium]|nr:fluoride efflux transporter CrcB [Pseudobdellovibrionaceae bacterium]|tara:strand:+ start:428 stop:796 length:369 start_codon:yes stop_codon:yes gene_type:complete
MAVKTLFFIGTFGSLGAICRYGVSFILPASQFPLTTLIINLIGAFGLGLALSFFQSPSPFVIGITVGFFGSFTTFSTFSIDTLRLLQNGLNGPAIFYIGASVIGGLLLGLLGLKTGAFLNHL